jgi:regulator of sigma E protease
MIASIFNGVLGYILMLGPLVLLHELGHYLVAAGAVCMPMLSIGFGSEIFGWTAARWKVPLAAAGSYVKFAGDMNAASMPIDDIPLSLAERERCFQFKLPWAARRQCRMGCDERSADR